MFKAFLNDSLFFDASVSMDELALSSAKLSLEAGKAGAFTFTLHPSNVMYDQFHKFTSYVDVYKKDRLIFSGRVLEEKKGFQNQQEIICEGLLAVFNDTVIRPFTHSGTLEALLVTFLNSHNSQVAADKRVSLGNITVTDSNNYVGRTYENYETTMKRLEDLAASLGGYFVVRKTDSGLVLDYLKDFTEYSGQTINFGENLLDLTRESTGADMITALIPLGAIDDETQEKLTIAEVNDGLDYLVNQVALDEYGWILGVQEWADVTSVTNLKNKGLAYLADKSKSRITINVSAVDMAKANSDISGFLCGQYIKVKSSLHGINEYLLAVKQDLDLLQPANNKMTLGTTRLGFIGQNNQNSANVIANVKKQAEAAAAKKTVKLETEIKQNAEAIQSVASQITTIGEQVTVAESMATQTAEMFSWIVKSGTSETDFTLTDRVATLMAQEFNITGLTTFMNAAMDGSATVINGGAIETNTILVDRLQAGTLDGFVVSQGGRTGINDSEHPTGSYFGADGFALGSALKYDAATDTITIAGSTTLKWADIEDVPSDLVYDGDISDFVKSSQVTTITQNAISSATIRADQVLAGAFTMTGGSISILAASDDDIITLSSSSGEEADIRPQGLFVYSPKYGAYNTITSDVCQIWNLTVASICSLPSSTYLNGSLLTSMFASSGHSHSGINGSYNNIYADYIYFRSPVTASVDTVYRSTGTGNRLGTSSSLRRYKNSIGEVTDKMLLPERLYDLPVRQFKWNEDVIGTEYDYEQFSIGFIAEEVDEIYPRATIYREGELASWSERNMIPPMLALIQQQKKLIDDLTQRVERIEAQ